MRVAFQGEKGSYSEEAVIKHFGAEAEPGALSGQYLRSSPQ
jgi:prephenate dehydratase